LATKKTKEPLQKPVTQLQKTKVVNDPLPGQLEMEFRRSLGRHNLHLNMLELSAQTFADTLSKHPSEASYVRDCAKKRGFHSLYPNTSFASARTYLVYSHIAYVFSAGDMLCDRIRSTGSIKALKKDDVALFNQIDKGDFVRKTLALTVLASMPPERRHADAVIVQVEKIQALESFALVNYYRLIRNEELHAAGESDRRTVDARGALPEERIKTVYGMMPAPLGQLSYRDALLCSKAWQSVSKWLCRHMLSEAESQATIRERFGRLEAQRRNAAVRRFLELELLYSKNDIDATVSALGW
jgi:hypothetical protein